MHPECVRWNVKIITPGYVHNLYFSNKKSAGEVLVQISNMELSDNFSFIRDEFDSVICFVRNKVTALELVQEDPSFFELRNKQIRLITSQLEYYEIEKKRLRSINKYGDDDIVED